MLYITISIIIAGILLWATYETKKTNCCSDGDEQWCNIECHCRKKNN